MNDHIKLADNFLLHSIIDGKLAHSYDIERNIYVKPYPEATGYILSYFAEYYHDVPEEVLSAADYLCKIQHESGGYQSFDNTNYLFSFDTSQIMHGLASLYDKTHKEQYLIAAKNCASFIKSMMRSNGSVFPIYNIAKKAKYVNRWGDWGNSFSYIQTKNIEGLLLMFSLTQNSEYFDMAVKLKNYGKKKCRLEFTHPSAYCLEGLWAIDEKKFVAERLKKEIIPRIKVNGFLSYHKKLPYAYVSGSCQMGILLYKADFKDYAYLILQWARQVQSHHDSGGLFQYANPDGSLNSKVHSQINTWGTKYYAQLERLFS